MDFLQSSAVISVDLEVTRFRRHPIDGMVEVWGYVGDYEVCIWLPVEEALSRQLVPNKWPGKGTRKRKKDQA